MKPATLKLSITAACLAFMLFGALILVRSMSAGAGSFAMTLGAMLILVPASVMVTRLPRLWKLQSMTLNWYQATYPQAIQGGQVACYECGSDRIQARKLDIQTGHHGHFCGECDTTLYYS
ncbi:MAG: hypothetical protein R3175_08720 [Marinobacter sp.]|uniref:hypothetical protein n=1 Tax=Marinobacter sp. TaxID=50741 RepID=UPI00299D4F46|nr:hypothetical protein [Marinobacter sp.]MDX1756126.1 hypothetical protein [Marinobacter sp.]